MCFEEDVDSKTIMKNWVASQARVQRLENDLEKSEKKYEKEAKKGKEKLGETFSKLVKVQETVVKPMI